MLRFGPNRISDTETQRILKMIEAGKFHVGDPLPGQRELAKMLGVSRSALRESIRYLEAVGVLETKVGLGTFVIHDTPNSFGAYFDSWLLENRGKVLKIFEVREALETKSAELAALHADDLAIEKIRASLEELQYQIQQDQVRLITAADADFHIAISNACGNNLLHQIISGLQPTIYESRLAVMAIPGRPERSLIEHREIFNAICNKDSTRAQLAMSNHLKSAAHDILR